jgi:carboxyl-terminal processing protease
VKKLMPSRIGRVALPLMGFFIGCALAGSLLNQRVTAQQEAPDEGAMRDSLRQFANVYSLVEQNYAEPMTADKADKVIYDGAIPGMLQVLDPHSSISG